jgi:hypothetical protein
MFGPSKRVPAFPLFKLHDEWSRNEIQQPVIWHFRETHDRRFIVATIERLRGKDYILLLKIPQVLRWIQICYACRKRLLKWK